MRRRPRSGPSTGSIQRLATFDGGGSLAAQLGPTTLAILDPSTGEERGRLEVAAMGEMTAAGSSDAIVGRTADVTDPDALAKELVAVLGGDETAYRDQLKSGAERVFVDAALTDDARTDLNDAIANGRLPGITIEPVAQLAVAGGDGVTFVGPAGTVTARCRSRAARIGLALVTGIDDGSQIYATSANADGIPEVAIIYAIGDRRRGWTGPVVDVPAARRRRTDRVRRGVRAGRGPRHARRTAAARTIYVVEPHGRAVFADHRCRSSPSAWVLDHNADYPSDDQGQHPRVRRRRRRPPPSTSGSYPFAWRMPGVILGRADDRRPATCSRRLLFRRRARSPCWSGLFVLLDGMFFVQSRIAMNDVYTGFFILAAYLLFAWLWLEPVARGAAFWLVMPAIGVLLGLALASKWVAAYAIGALGILVLVRSALGRIILILGLDRSSRGVLGWMAMAVPTDSDGARATCLFPLIMIALTLAAVVVDRRTTRSPGPTTRSGSPSVRRRRSGSSSSFGAIAAGKAQARRSPSARCSSRRSTLGFALVVAVGLAYAAFQLGGRLGLGPMAPPPEPGRPERARRAARGGRRRAGSASGWLSGSRSSGWSACLIGIPLVVYVISYIPWAFDRQPPAVRRAGRRATPARRSST